jgi:aldoxime dehydratase
MANCTEVFRSVRRFGMSWWHGLQDLETWSESHPTHLAIFRAAMKYLVHDGTGRVLRSTV